MSPPNAVWNVCSKRQIKLDTDSDLVCKKCLKSWAATAYHQALDDLVEPWWSGWRHSCLQVAEGWRAQTLRCPTSCISFSSSIQEFQLKTISKAGSHSWNRSSVLSPSNLLTGITVFTHTLSCHLLLLPLFSQLKCVWHISNCYSPTMVAPLICFCSSASWMESSSLSTFCTSSMRSLVGGRYRWYFPRYASPCNYPTELIGLIKAKGPNVFFQQGQSNFTTSICYNHHLLGSITSWGSSSLTTFIFCTLNRQNPR